MHVSGDKHHGLEGHEVSCEQQLPLQWDYQYIFYFLLLSIFNFYLPNMNVYCFLTKKNKTGHLHCIFLPVLLTLGPDGNYLRQQKFRNICFISQKQSREEGVCAS